MTSRIFAPSSLELKPTASIFFDLLDLGLDLLGTHGLAGGEEGGNDLLGLADEEEVRVAGKLGGDLLVAVVAGEDVGGLASGAVDDGLDGGEIVGEESPMADGGAVDGVLLEFGGGDFGAVVVFLFDGGFFAALELLAEACDGFFVAGAGAEELEADEEAGIGLVERGDGEEEADGLEVDEDLRGVVAAGGFTEGLERLFEEGLELRLDADLGEGGARPAHDGAWNIGQEA